MASGLYPSTKKCKCETCKCGKHPNSHEITNWPFLDYYTEKVKILYKDDIVGESGESPEFYSLKRKYFPCYFDVTENSRISVYKDEEEITKKKKKDLYYLNLCLAVLEGSKDPSTKVGAVIVGPDGEIRSTGFNGFPMGVLDLPERWNIREEKYKLVVHSERNAVLLAARAGISTNGCTVYLAAKDANTGEIWGGAPCLACTIELIQAGIKEIVSFPFKNTPSRWKESLEESKKILEEVGIHYREVKNG